MESKVKYQYTYFIKPFFIKENTYEKYLLSLIKSEKYSLKIFEKEKDFNLYSFFFQNIREYFFPSFSFDKRKISQLNSFNNNIKAKILSKLHCNIFEYKLDKKIQGKISDENGVFFNIEKIEIICLDTGVCFLVIKTNIDNTENFSDLLDFNYKFKDINSDFSKLKDYNNIKIQTDMFANMSDISKFIDKITGVNHNTSKLDLYNKRFFVYTYVCIDQENWNKDEDFNNIEQDFLRYSNVLPNNSTLNFNIQKPQKTIEVVEQFKYAKFGFTKQSASLMTSNIDINNYTNLLFEYENEYLYTLLISLYQRICLKRIENELKNKQNMEKVRIEFLKFAKEIWVTEITNSLTGTIFYNKWKQVFELEQLYDELKSRYDIIYKELNIEKDTKLNKTILTILAVSILLNIVNLITIIKIT
ncbi:MAG: hypothetical protein Q4G09_02155 [Clostridia bacterium]|nr:hypothetical protein [Clostridia bacterium]